jgi:hypothetical protein
MGHPDVEYGCTPHLDAGNETAGVFGVPHTKPAPDASVTDWDTLTRRRPAGVWSGLANYPAHGDEP